MKRAAGQQWIETEPGDATNDLRVTINQHAMHPWNLLSIDIHFKFKCNSKNWKENAHTILNQGASVWFYCLISCSLVSTKKDTETGKMVWKTRKWWDRGGCMLGCSGGGQRGRGCLHIHCSRGGPPLIGWWQCVDCSDNNVGWAQSHENESN